MPAWINNHMPSTIWEEISHPFHNFNGCTGVVWEWMISSHTSHTWLPAWWALWLLWWPLTDAAMFQCAYKVFFSGIVPLVYSVGNKTYFYYYSFIMQGIDGRNASHISYHIIAHHVTSRHVMSYHIILKCSLIDMTLIGKTILKFELYWLHDLNMFGR